MCDAPVHDAPACGALHAVQDSLIVHPDACMRRPACCRVQVSSLFSSSGTVLAASWLRVKTVHDGVPAYKNALGTAFVTMPPSDAEAAIRQLHGSVVQGKAISVAKYVKGARD